MIANNPTNINSEIARKAADVEVVDFLRLLNPVSPFEVRAVSANGAVANKHFAAGCWDAAAEYVKRLDQSGAWAGIYSTINALKSADNGAACNADIERRRWLYLDFDADRIGKEGKILSGVPATAGEVEAARGMFNAVLVALDLRGWQSPLTTFTGNGCAAYFPIDLPNDDEAAQLVRRILAGLARHFDMPGATLDLTVSDAARLTRIAGTMNRKAESIDERAHRRAALISRPADGIVDADDLRRLADELSPPDPPTKNSGIACGNGTSGLSPGDDFDRNGPGFDEILEPHGWSLIRGTPDNGYWRRPGKDWGVSATTRCRGKAGEPLIHIFSSNAPPFEGSQSYGKFRALAFLTFNGDLSASGRTLYADGYGERVNGDRARSGGAVFANGNNAVLPLVEGSLMAAANETGASRGGGGAQLVIRKASELKAKPIKFLVPGRIAFGKVTLIGGRGGDGKSTLIRSLAAAASAGRCALGMQYDAPAPIKVLIMETEEGPEDTILPGLAAEGANLERIGLLEGIKCGGRNSNFMLMPEHIELLKERLRQSREIKLIIIDPIASYVGQLRINDSRAAELRTVLDPLNQLAEETGAAIIILAHLNKGTGDAVDRIAGSAAYRDAVRCAYLVAVAHDDPDKRLLMPIKENLPGILKTSVPFRLVPLDDAEASRIIATTQFCDLNDDDQALIRSQLRRVQFEAAERIDVNEVMKAAGKRKDPNKVEKCVAWLRELLKNYAYPSDEILKSGKAAGFTFDNIKEAKALLKNDGLKNSNRDQFQGAWWSGFGDPASWTLRPKHLPDPSPSSPITPLPPQSPDIRESSLFPYAGDSGDNGDQGAERAGQKSTRGFDEEPPVPVPGDGQLLQMPQPIRSRIEL